MSAAAALVSFLGVIDATSSKTDVRSGIFGLATALTVVGVLWSAILVNTLAGYATQARKLKRARKRLLGEVDHAE